MLGMMYGTYSYVSPKFSCQMNEEAVLLPCCKTTAHVTDNQTLSTSG